MESGQNFESVIRGSANHYPVVLLRDIKLMKMVDQIIIAEI